MFFTLGETDDAVVKALKREFFSCIGTERVIQKAMIALTDDYGCMVKVDTSSKNVKNMVFRYKAKDRGQYKIGSQSFRDYIFKHHDKAEKSKQGVPSDGKVNKNSKTRIRVYKDKGKKAYIDKYV